MNERGAIARLEAWTQEELGAQRRAAEILAEQERALIAGDVAATLALRPELDALANAAAARAARGRERLDDLARGWGLAAGTLTLTSALSRAGEAGRRLDGFAAELRQAAREVARLLGVQHVLVRAQQAFLSDVARTVAGRAGADLDGRGALVDARA